jgi:multicomponent Na+:H+ antiporter subunit F
MTLIVTVAGFDLLNIVFGALSIALFLTLWRLIKGPTLPDRVVALDLLAVIAVGLIATYAIDLDQPVFIDVAIVVALVAFLGTVAFAQYVERRAADE